MRTSSTPTARNTIHPVPPTDPENLNLTGNLHSVAAPRRDSVWRRRLGIVLYVIFSVELGIVLVLLPWKDVWTNNSFFASYPGLRLWLNHDFVRGAVSGLGLLNIWIGISEAAHFRDR